jgi:hypothetical protein
MEETTMPKFTLLMALLVGVPLLATPARAEPLAGEERWQLASHRNKGACIKIGGTRICLDDGRSGSGGGRDFEDEEVFVPKKSKGSGGFETGQSPCPAGFIAAPRKSGKAGWVCEPMEQAEDDESFQGQGFRKSSGKKSLSGTSSFKQQPAFVVKKQTVIKRP